MDFYRLKIGQFLVEIWPKTFRKGGRLYRGGAFIGEFTVHPRLCDMRFSRLNLNPVFHCQQLHFGGGGCSEQKCEVIRPKHAKSRLLTGKSCKTLRLWAVPLAM